MPYSGRTPEQRRCIAKSKRTGEQCRAPSVPFTETLGYGNKHDPPRPGGLCKTHGGWTPAIFEKARAAARRYEQGWHPEHENRPSDFERRVRLERWYESEGYYERHRIKRGMSKEAFAEFERQEAQTRTRTKAEERKRAAERRAEKRGEPRPETDAVVGRPIEFDFDFADDTDDWPGGSRTFEFAGGDWEL